MLDLTKMLGFIRHRKSNLSCYTECHAYLYCLLCGTGCCSFSHNTLRLHHYLSQSETEFIKFIANNYIQYLCLQWLAVRDTYRQVIWWGMHFKLQNCCFVIKFSKNTLSPAFYNYISIILGVILGWLPSMTSVMQVVIKVPPPRSHVYDLLPG